MAKRRKPGSGSVHLRKDGRWEWRCVVGYDQRGYLLLRSHFVFYDYSEPVILFLINYLSVMVMFVLIGYLISMLLKRLPTFYLH